MPDNKILVSRPYYQGLGLGVETWWPRSWSWSRDLVAKVLVLVSRPGGQGLGLGLELISKVLITSLTKCHKSNFYLQTELCPSITLPFQQRTFFNKCKGRLYRFLGQFRQFLTFSLHSKDFSHHSSFELSRNCFINPAST